MRKALIAAALVGGASLALAQSPFHAISPGPRALPGDRLPPFAVLDDQGQLQLSPPPLPPGVHLPQPGGPPESTAPGPSLAEATRMAQAAVRACSALGYRTGAAVVDSKGELRAGLTADGADGSHIFVAMRKTEVTRVFAMPSSAANALLQKDKNQLGKVTPAMFVEGGAVPIERNGKIIGAIGVSGAAGMPIGHNDEVCAQAGIKAMTVRRK
ncbi:MAG: heme-binding protein [Proteobacteria bacterium]|nr:heme-binding protein [Pseudomonadota bacterium]